MLQRAGYAAEAGVHLEEALALNRTLGNRNAVGFAVGALGVLRMEQGRTEEARAHSEFARTIHR